MKRFWDKVEKTDTCWIWKSSTRSGYGGFKFKGKKYSAHRFSWFLCFGEIPIGKFICHHCDNPLCVRPDHLFLGTPRDNVIDAIKKGRIIPYKGNRFKKGEPSLRRKLNQKEVISIKKEYLDTNVSYRKLGRKYGISRQGICDILKGKSYLSF